jgi:hypothetical protein
MRKHRLLDGRAARRVMQQNTRETNAGVKHSRAATSKTRNLIDFGDQIKLEFDTLRKEIEAAKIWEVRLLVGGLVGFPAAFEFARKTDDSSNFYLVVCFLPLGILVLSFLVAFVRWSAMRCGQYIREVLEPHFPLGGWETWLGEDKVRRRSERLLANAFLLLVSIYYIVAASIGFIRFQTQLPYERLMSGAVASAYMIGFLLTIVFASTPTQNDQTALDRTPLARLASFIGQLKTRLRRKII